MPVVVPVPPVPALPGPRPLAPRGRAPGGARPGPGAAAAAIAGPGPETKQTGCVIKTWPLISTLGVEMCFTSICASLSSRCALAPPPPLPRRRRRPRRPDRLPAPRLAAPSHCSLPGRRVWKCLIMSNISCQTKIVEIYFMILGRMTSHIRSSLSRSSTNSSMWDNSNSARN